MERYKSLFIENTSLLNNIENYIEQIFPNLKDGRLYRISKNDNSISYTSKKNFNTFLQITLYDHIEPNFVIIKGEKIVEVSSVSLADPKAAYQTTSARRVKTKKIKIEKDVRSLDKAKKVIDSYKKRLNKIKVDF